MCLSPTFYYERLISEMPADNLYDSIFAHLNTGQEIIQLKQREYSIAAEASKFSGGCYEKKC